MTIAPKPIASSQLTKDPTFVPKAYMAQKKVNNTSPSPVLQAKPRDYNSPAPKTPSIKCEDTSSEPTTSAQKRQERLIKNRAAALLSRKRKREHLDELEQKVEALSAENCELKRKISELEGKLSFVSSERDIC